jgi:hypothetical protein
MAIISNAVTIADAGAFSVSLGSMVHIKTLTASGDATLSFVDGTADVVWIAHILFISLSLLIVTQLQMIYLFNFQGSIDAGSNYNVAITSTHFRATHGEDGSSEALAYITSGDLAQGTGFQLLAGSVGNDADQSLGGELFIYNPSSTTFVKHFTGNFQSIAHSNRTNNQYPAGYFNTTSALDAFQFKFSSGNIDDGKIKLYGIKDS